MIRSLLTTDGRITCSRYVLRPADSGSMEKLLETDGSSTVIPLDCALHVNRLPFKMTVSMMLKVAFYATVLGSYQAAEDIIGKIYGTPVNDDTIRLVVNHIGKTVFEADCRAADECMEQLEKGRLLHSSDKDGILYLETGGAALNTRFKDENGSTWRENKLGLVFSSDNIHTWKDKHGKPCHQILDFFHLCENTHAFAKLLYKTDESRAKAWAREICDQLEDGKYEDVLKVLTPL